ncbi:Alpha/Beta hydrolase protein [Macrophomina phaseolina]|uniref:Alpha/Beta hydrolase protein n=1 Tax=Macrophomina phaseolina TaxID=35725 RepID=A0ABQ8GWE4_9PEZI|nr:Alpha/Beta hydrolase protein [Macrophomina phaseolina]
MALLQLAALAVAAPSVLYFAILGILIAFPAVQTHVFYLHRLSLIRFKDLNVPEAFGFLRGQVTPFSVHTPDAETLHAWLVLPLGAYRRHEEELLAESTSLASDVTARLAFRLLRHDPEARLVIYLHGTAGCLASGWRPDSYRALSSTAPEKIHILAADYRGYGFSTGTPSEEGLLVDAVAIADWAMNVAGIPPSRIVIFGQSLGTAVATSLVRHYAMKSPPIMFSGTVLVASFSDVATLTATYRIGGVIPVLSPLSKIPPLLKFFNSYLKSTWMSKDRVAEFIRRGQSRANSQQYHITFIHAEDDTDIGCLHSEIMFWHAVNASAPKGISFEELERQKALKKRDLGSGGWAVEWKAAKGTIRLEMLQYGVHDKLMAYPVTSMAVLRAFQASDPAFGH